MVSPKTSIVLLSLLVAGCAWNALYSKPTIAPVHVGLSKVQNPLPGKYLLRLTSNGLDQNVRVGGVVCTTHDFPMQASQSFEKSVQQTLASVVEKLEIVPAQLTQKQLKASRARALITITGNTLAGNLLVDPGFLTKASTAKVQVSARVQVLTPKGQTQDKLVESTESSTITVGRCLDAHRPVDAALAKSFRQLIEKIGGTVSLFLRSGK